jgi:hypothetical protein
MRPTGDINRTRAAERRLAWIGFGTALLVCSAFGYWVIVKDEAALEAAVRRANPSYNIGFSRGLLGEIKLWSCGINALAGVGIIVRGLMIRVPAG